MEITINSAENPLTLSNTDYDNPNLLDLREEDGSTIEGIDIEDIYCAILAFRTMRDNDHKRQAQLLKQEHHD